MNRNFFKKWSGSTLNSIFQKKSKVGVMLVVADIIKLGVNHSDTAI